MQRNFSPGGCAASRSAFTGRPGAERDAAAVLVEPVLTASRRLAGWRGGCGWADGRAFAPARDMRPIARLGSGWGRWGDACVPARGGRRWLSLGSRIGQSRPDVPAPREAGPAELEVTMLLRQLNKIREKRNLRVLE